MPEEFHFLRPYFLGLFIVLGFFVVLLFRKARQSNAWLKVCDPQLVSHLLVGVESKASYTPLVLLSLVGSLLIVALAGPAWSKLPQAVFQAQESRVYVLDLSRSMDATDLAPSRITLAKLKLIDLLKSHTEGQVGLVAFAGLAHVISPLTSDANTIVSMVPSLSTDIMPVRGSVPVEAVHMAHELLKQAGSTKGDVVLITDGADPDAMLDDAQQLVNEGYQLHVIGVGTPQGAPIPIDAGGYLKDNHGAIVIPKLKRADLKEIALAGSGKYVDISIDDSDVKKLAGLTLENTTKQQSENQREVDVWRDQGHWLLIVALPLAAFGFRRGWLGILVITFCIMPVDETLAFEWADLWQRKDQQAQEMLKQGDAENAAKLFENKAWKGTAHYRNGDFEAAAESFSQSDSAAAKYNYATALAKQGKIQEALDVYDEVIEQQPDNSDAIFNRDLLKKVMQQQEEKQPQDSNEKSDESEEKSEEESEQQSAQDGDENQSSDSDEKNEKTEQEQQSKDVDKSSATEQPEQESEPEQESAQDSEQQADSETKQREEELRQEQESAEGEQAEREKLQQELEQETSEEREERQANEQWLRRIPDDPGGLLREKFNRQSQRSRQRQNTENPW